MCISDSENTGVPERKQRQNQTTREKGVRVHHGSSSDSESDQGIVCTKRIRNVRTNSRASSTTESMP